MCISIERRKWNQNGHNSQSEQRMFKIIENIARSQLESNKHLTEARENKSDQVAIDFSFESDWFRKWREFSGPITEQS